MKKIRQDRIMSIQTKKVIVGLSGGVDSALTAAILQQQGYSVSTVYMRNWHDHESHCNSHADEASARAVAEHLALPFTVIDFSQDYLDRVFTVMLDILRQGHTPNPDILCNQEIKFRCLLDYVKQQGADFLATGHYARIVSTPRGNLLAQAVDQMKDQSYFLCCMPKDALDQVLFPLGEYLKPDVRKLALDLDLPSAKRKDSTGICFIGERRFSDFISQHLLDRPGPIVDEHGQQLGQHRGLFYYTIGQRKGLAIGGLTTSAEQPWYVVAKDLNQRRLIVAQGDQHPLLYSKTLRALQPRWFSEPKDDPCVLQAKIRHRQADQACTITCKNAEIMVDFKEPQRAIAPGQYIAFYAAKVCLGAAIIKSC